MLVSRFRRGMHMQMRVAVSWAAVRGRLAFSWIYRRKSKIYLFLGAGGRDDLFWEGRERVVVLPLVCMYG